MVGGEGAVIGGRVGVRGHAQAVEDSVVDIGAEGLRDLVGQGRVGVGRDAQLVGGVHAVPGRQRTQHVLGVFEEILVEIERGGARWTGRGVELDSDLPGAGELAGSGSGFLSLLPDTKYQQIGDGFGARHATEGAGGQTRGGN